MWWRWLIGAALAAGAGSEVVRRLERRLELGDQGALSELSAQVRRRIGLDGGETVVNASCYMWPADPHPKATIDSIWSGHNVVFEQSVSVADDGELMFYVSSSSPSESGHNAMRLVRGGHARAAVFSTFTMPYRKPSTRGLNTDQRREIHDEYREHVRQVALFDRQSWSEADLRLLAEWPKQPSGTILRNRLETLRLDEEAAQPRAALFNLHIEPSVSGAATHHVLYVSDGDVQAPTLSISRDEREVAQFLSLGEFELAPTPMACELVIARMMQPDFQRLCAAAVLDDAEVRDSIAEILATISFGRLSREETRRWFSEYAPMVAPVGYDFDDTIRTFVETTATVGPGHRSSLVSDAAEGAIQGGLAAAYERSSFAGALAWTRQATTRKWETREMARLVGLGLWSMGIHSNAPGHWPEWWLSESAEALTRASPFSDGAELAIVDWQTGEVMGQLTGNEYTVESIPEVVSAVRKRIDQAVAADEEWPPDYGDGTWPLHT